MSGYELLAIAVFFLIGYWLVDYFWPKKTPAAAAGERVTVRVQRRFDAPAERVFDAWLDPQSAGRWLFATPEGQMVRVEIDARVGGQFSFTDRRAGDDVEHLGEYLEIDRPRRLAFNFRVPKFSDAPVLIRIDFAPAASGPESTLLTLVHEGVFAEYATRTEEGWKGILEVLAKTLGVR
ncbi:MAG: SRPBCC family protein [Burkholderiales bacterium]